MLTLPCRQGRNDETWAVTLTLSEILERLQVDMKRHKAFPVHPEPVEGNEQTQWTKLREAPLPNLGKCCTWSGWGALERITSQSSIGGGQYWKLRHSCLLVMWFQSGSEILCIWFWIFHAPFWRPGGVSFQLFSWPGSLETWELALELRWTSKETESYHCVFNYSREQIQLFQGSWVYPEVLNSWGMDP